MPQCRLRGLKARKARKASPLKRGATLTASTLCQYPHLHIVLQCDAQSTRAYAWHPYAHNHSRHIYCDLAHPGFDVHRGHRAFPYRVVGCEDRYRAGPRSRQDRSFEQFVFRRSLGGFRCFASRGRRDCPAVVPAYMPWPLFWAYFFGFALLAASLSIATKIQVRWSGLLWGIAMFLFVAMMDIPGALSNPRDRFGWTLAIREMTFGGGGWILAGNEMSGPAKSKLITVGRVLIAIAAIFYGVEHFLHPLSRPGVPLEQLMPAWIPGRLLIGYVTGAILLIAGVFILLAKKTRMAATYLGTWIVLLVVFIYGPILIASLADPSTDIKIEGINYFADTLLFAGAILALASATPRTD